MIHHKPQHLLYIFWNASLPNLEPSWKQVLSPADPILEEMSHPRFARTLVINLARPQYRCKPSGCLGSTSQLLPEHQAAKPHNEDLSPLKPAAPRITVPGAGGLSSSSCRFTLLRAQGPSLIGANTIPGDVEQPGPETATELQPACWSLWVRTTHSSTELWEFRGVKSLIMQCSCHMGTDSVKHGTRVTPLQLPGWNQPPVQLYNHIFN